MHNFLDHVDAELCHNTTQHIPKFTFSLFIYRVFFLTVTPPKSSKYKQVKGRGKKKTTGKKRSG